MTKPTQAQIEAAAKAMMDQQLKDEDQDFKAMAKAALTAAAEVDDQARHDAQVDRYVTLGEAMRQQTIERCAQVAETQVEKWSFAMNPQVLEKVIAEIAAAIRALKDKP